MPDLTPHRGVLILILGILGLVVCPFVGIAAWMMGREDLQDIDAGQMDPQGRSLTQAGLILGIIAVVLLVLSVLIFLFVMAVGLVSSAS